MTVNEAVTFTVRITNTGSTVLATVPLTDAFETAHLSFSSASPPPDSSSGGTLSWSNLAGSGLNPGSSLAVTVGFQAVGSTALRPGQVTTNTATVSGAVDAFNRTAPSQSDSAQVQVTEPGIGIRKQAEGVTDDWLVAGTGVTFTVAVSNTGNTTLTSVTVQESFDENEIRFVRSSLPPDSVAVNQIIWNDITTDLGDIAPGGGVNFSVFFTVTGNVGQISNLALVTAAVDENGDSPSLAQGSGTASFAVAAIGYVIESDPPGGSNVTPEQCIRYDHLIENTGAVDLTNVVLTIFPPEGTTVVEACLPEGRSSQVAGNHTPPIVQPLGDMAIGQRLSIPTFVTVNRQPNVNFILIRGLVESDQTGAVAFGGQATNPLDPTAVELLSFSARPVGGGVRLAWATGAELDSWGFHLLRSQTGRLADAQRITPSLIPATGSNSQYSYLDPTGSLDSAYWLEETELDGTRLTYGPVWVSGPGGQTPSDAHSIFLPLVNATPAVGR